MHKRQNSKWRGSETGLVALDSPTDVWTISMWRDADLLEPDPNRRPLLQEKGVTRV